MAKTPTGKTSAKSVGRILLYIMIWGVLPISCSTKTTTPQKNKSDESVDIDFSYRISGAYNDSIKKAQEELKYVLRPCECNKCRKCKCTKQDCQF